MIILYGINLSGTTWLADMLGAVSEPFEVDIGAACPDQPGIEAHAAQALELRGLRRRLVGYNEQVAAADHDRIAALYRSFAKTWPQATGLKTLTMVYWDIMREVWPDAQFVFLKRDLWGWLNAIARWELRLQWYAEPACWFLYGDMANPPAALEAERVADAYGVPEHWRPLLRAAYYRDAKYRWWEERQPDDILTTSFAGLMANWNTEIPRVLEGCGLPAPDSETLRGWAQPVSREWPSETYTYRDVAGVIEILQGEGLEL